MVLQHSLELNSARALSLESCHQEAVDKFRALEASGDRHASFRVSESVSRATQESESCMCC